MLKCGHDNFAEPLLVALSSCSRTTTTLSRLTLPMENEYLLEIHDSARTKNETTIGEDAQGAEPECLSTTLGTAESVVHVDFQVFLLLTVPYPPRNRR